MEDLLERRLTGAISTSFYRVHTDVYYRGVEVGHFRADLLVQRKVIVDVKASLAVVEADRNQLLNYLRGTSLELILLHFGPKPSFQRLIYTKKARETQCSRRGLSLAARVCDAVSVSLR